MELKPGYTMTELGVLPEDWEVRPLGDYSVIYRGGSPRPIEKYLTTASDGCNWVKIGDVQSNAKYIFKTEEKIIKSGIRYSRCVQKGDFLLSNSMSFGRPYILQIDGCIHDGWLVIQGYQHFYDTDFFYYLLCSEEISKQYKVKAAGSGVLNLNKELVSSVNVTCPPLPEQRAIAAALSDVDALLDAQERLIAKKRHIKLAAMQQLLTGKTRLPGFVRAWKELCIHDFAELRTQRVIPAQMQGSHLCIELEHIVPCTGKLNGTVCSSDVFSYRYQFEVGDILFGRLRAYLQKFYYASFKGACSTEFWVLNTNSENIDSRFFYHLIQTKKFIEAASIAYGTHMPRSDWKLVRNIAFSIPQDKDEQRAIAAVLSDMDAELAALEARRDKLRAIRQGMMQELLTGRTRLVGAGGQHGQ